MTDEEVARVAATLKQVIAGFRRHALRSVA
jgi:hypothetical protein